MNSLFEIVLDEIKKILSEEDYRGEHHTAPSSDYAPMHDLTDTYPDDIYSEDAARLYHHYNDYRDRQAIGVIQSARNKPNQSVKIYRAVPDINYDLKTKLKPLLDIVNYHSQWNRFPAKNQLVWDLQDKYSIDNHSYDEQQKLILNDINKQINELQAQQQKQIGINNGDWVTISREYAKEHGESHLNGQYKIVTKTVPARNLYTDANNIFEWGYNVG